MQIRLRPFLPLSLFRSRAFVVVSGVVSLFTLLFVVAFDGALIYGMSAHSDIEVQMAWMSGFHTVPIYCCAVFVCVIAPAVAIAMVDHLMQNSRVPVVRQSLWAVVIIIGIGMILYWYFHIVRVEESVLPQEV